MALPKAHPDIFDIYVASESSIKGVEEKYDNILREGGILVTGGAGFIGSHLVDKLSASFPNELDLRIIDNLSSCDNRNITQHFNHKFFHFMHSNFERVDALIPLLQDTRTVFHLAAYPEVRTGLDHPDIPFEQNIRGTYILLENIRKSQVENIYFTSSSTVYGEAKQIPTPEDYGPLIPISIYGASKLACEALISSYCHTYGLKAQLFRLANVVGARSTHGVVPDLIRKIRANDMSVELLGDGTQSKSYIHIRDCIDCVLFCLSNQKQPVEIYNIGANDQINVISIAKLVSKIMGKGNIRFVTKRSIQSGARGWVGDVTHMQLDITKLLHSGWTPTMTSRQAISLAAKQILESDTSR